MRESRLGTIWVTEPVVGSLAMTSDPNESQLRYLEAELDKAHEQLPFWSGNQARGRFSLLAAFDSYHPMKIEVFSDGSVARAQQWRHLEAGLPIAMRWANARHKGPDEFEFDHSEMVAAGYFLNHAADAGPPGELPTRRSRGKSASAAAGEASKPRPPAARWVAARQACLRVGPFTFSSSSRKLDSPVLSVQITRTR